ncbi:hypothetical protein HK099_006160, partial [Clydaea vesicula]
GTLAGVRGFQDPNVQMKKNKNSIFLQADKNSPDKVNNETILMPWLLSTYEGQCLTGGSNQRYETVMAWNSSNENTVEILGVNSMSYFDRSGIPFYYSLADNYLIGDNYKESVMANTCPNRVVYMAGTTMPERDYNGKNIPVESNSVQNKPYMDWETFPEHLEKHNITWRIWQNSLDLYDSNALSWFEQYQPKNNNTALIEKALTFFSLAEFQKACANGTLPQISWVISEQQLSEHPPWLPNSGEYFISQVSKAIITGKHANSTAAIINYDESGGFFDHVDPEVPAFGTPYTWVLKDRLFKNQPAPVGPGPRVPFFIISPYTKGKVVFSENSDHTSTLLFLEQWVLAKFQINITFPLISKWHREHMSDLVNAFDFTETNLTMNLLPTVKKPQQNVFTKVFVSSELCLTSQHFNGIPTPPYKNQTFPSVEAGFRTVRGYPLQGRFFTLESGKFSLTTYKYEVQLRPTIIKRNDPQQLFIFLETYGEKNRFKIKSLKVKNETGKSYCLNFDLNLVKCAIAPIWDFKMSEEVENNQGYEITFQNKYFLLGISLLMQNPTINLQPSTPISPSGVDSSTTTAAQIQRQAQWTQMRYQSLLDYLTPLTTFRWTTTVALFFLYFLRVFTAQGWYIITYALGIYLLNLFLAFLTPKIDPSLELDTDPNDEGMSLPTKGNDEFKPFIRRLPEFKFWHACTRAVTLALLCTTTRATDIPVFWPILLMNSTNQSFWEELIEKQGSSINADKDNKTEKNFEETKSNFELPTFDEDNIGIKYWERIRTNWTANHEPFNPILHRHSTMSLPSSPKKQSDLLDSSNLKSNFNLNSNNDRKKLLQHIKKDHYDLIYKNIISQRSFSEPVPLDFLVKVLVHGWEKEGL